MKTQKKPGKMANKESVSAQPVAKPSKKNNNIIDDDEEFDIPLEDLRGLDNFDDFDEDDDY